MEMLTMNKPSSHRSIMTKGKMALFSGTMISALVAFAAPAYAQNTVIRTFELTSVPDESTAIYSDPAAPDRTITITLQPLVTQCARVNSNGRISVLASSNAATAPGCDQTIIINFQTSGFALDEIEFNEIDDFDGAQARDAFAASVAGVWTSPTIAVHSFANPPAFADQAARLTAAGAVGTFLSNNDGIVDPRDETAIFRPTVPTTSFNILFDDAQGGRGAGAQFGFPNIRVTFDNRADLVTQKILSSTDTQPAVGDEVTYQISVRNDGPTDASNVTLTDFLPAGLTPSSGNGSVNFGTYDSISGLWSIPSIAPGATATLNLSGIVYDTQGGQTIENITTAAISDNPDPSDAGNVLSASILIDDFIFADNDDFTAIAIGTSGATTPSVFANDTLNTDPFANAAVIPTITNNDGLTGVSINADGSLSIPANSPIGNFSVQYQICLTGEPTNCATATVNITISPEIDLAITKTNTPGVNADVDQSADELISLSTTTYVISVTNNGPDAATAAVISDTIGSGLTCDAANAVTITGDGVPAGNFTVADLIGSGITLDTLANGEASVLSYDCLVN